MNTLAFVTQHPESVKELQKKWKQMRLSEHLPWVFPQESFRKAPTWGDFADGGRMPAVSLVAVGALDEDGAVAQALGKNLPADVVQTHSPAWSKTQTNSSYGMTQADQGTREFIFQRRPRFFFTTEINYLQDPTAVLTAVAGAGHN